MTIPVSVGFTSATSAQAVAGTDDTVAMTPLQTANAIAALAPSLSLPSQTGNSGKFLTTNGTASSWGTPSGGGSTRTSLTANTTYYVRTDGSDSNTGTANTSGGAWLTLAHAYNYICSTLDFAGFNVTIQVADGTYATTTSTNIPVLQPWTGGGNVIINGNMTTPDNCILTTTTGTIVLIQTTLPGSLTFQGFKLTSTSGIAIEHTGVGNFFYGTLDFGSVGTGYHIYTGSPAAYIQCIGNYTISGGAGRHWGENGGVINCVSITITLTGTPAFGDFAVAHFPGRIEAYNNTYSGSATGVRYFADAAAVIFTNGAGSTAFPGNSSGSVATGGQYI